MFNSGRLWILNKSILATLAILGLLIPSYFANKDYPIANVMAAAVGKNQIPAVSYKNLESGKGSVVYINGKQVAWFVNSGDNNTEKKAQVLTQRLKDFLKNKKDANSIRPHRWDKYTVVKAGDQFLFTADEEIAKTFGVSTHELAFKWANDIRQALGAEKITHDYQLVNSRGRYTDNFQKKYLGKIYKGVASWYGHPFHGQTSSDGSRYNMNEFTAAHKSLPFGTLVKVTNQKNDKSCIVRITDRGPYVDGRIIDLSLAAAKEIDMQGSGVSKVELEIVGQY